MPSTNGHGSKPERVALYLRVSSEEQKTKESIETQDDFLEDYCKLYGHEVVSVYKDEAISGTVPMRERPEGARLLADAKTGAFDVLLVYKLDRVGRSLLVVVDAHDRLQEAGVALRSATEPIDTSTPVGRLIFQMLASFAEFERATITERSRDGLHRAFKEGKHFGRIPYGYDISSEDGKGFVVVEDEACVVREIIANVAAGATLYSEAKRLNDESKPSPGYKYRGKRRKHGVSWCHTTVRGIVTQRAYSGTHVVNAHKGLMERPVPAIVEPELQQKALARLQENKQYSGGKPHRKYLLRGLVWCSACGTAYIGGVSQPSGKEKRYYKYRCRKRGTAAYDRRVRNLSCPSVGAEWLEDLVWQDVRSFLRDPGEVLKRVRVQLAEDREGEDLEERRASLLRRLRAKQAEKSRYVKLYARGDLDEEELEVYLMDLRNQVENLKLLLGSVEADLAQKHENKMVAKSTEAWLLALRKNLADVEQDTEEAFERRRELVKLLVEKIAVACDEDGRAEAEITYRFGPPVSLEQVELENSVCGIQNRVRLGKAHPGRQARSSRGGGRA
jgi:site-specific DNA recombinase